MQQVEAEKEMKRMQEEKHLLEKQAKEQEQQLREGFALEMQRLVTRMEAANEEERAKLQKEIEKLNADQVCELVQAKQVVF